MIENDQQPSLKAFNTMGIAARSKAMLNLNHQEELLEFFTHKKDQEPWFILGGGSNVLFVDDFPGTILRMNIRHRFYEMIDDQYALVTAGAGESWPDFVAWTIQQNLGGLENLSLIPGKVGAAPIQNIGAYGVELKDRMVHLEAYEIATGKSKKILNRECGFDYRHSHFKGQWKDKYVITKVVFKLSHQRHQLNTAYGAIEQELAGIEQPSIQDLAAAVIRIRQSKLPDPDQLGNAGSFFKNPVINREQFLGLKKDFPNIPSYPVSDQFVKIPAAWLIDQCGWKGKRQGPVGCYDLQPLVLVNYGGASGSEVWSFAQKVRQSVKATFGILLEPEVNIIPES